MDSSPVEKARPALRIEDDGPVRTLVIDDPPRNRMSLAFMDASGLCLFPGGCGWTLADYRELVDLVCEGDWSSEERMRETGERIWNLEKMFNLKAGLSKKDDTLPKRILEEPADVGTAKGLVCRLDEMLPEYYAINGWDADGVPTGETLGRLGIA